VNNGVARFNRNTTTGAISQPAGAAGCVSEDGTGPCANGHALNTQTGVAVSPDGKSVYLASSGSNAVVRFNRNTTTGAITQPAGAAGCVSETGAGPCANGHGLINASAVVVSPDDQDVYVASYESNAVVRLNRNVTTGAISQPAGTAGCVSEDGTGPCDNGHALLNPYDVVVSPDGKSVYVASITSNAVARLNRNATTGAVTQPAGTAGCISEDGTGPCSNGHGLLFPNGLAVSPEGKSVYVASYSSHAVARLNRNTANGAITQYTGAAGCISEDGLGPCADGHGLFSPFAVAVSPNGESVYAASHASNAVVRLNREP
jgi:DNA-binding beta-propeller fold protein YncE